MEICDFLNYFWQILIIFDFFPWLNQTWETIFLNIFFSFLNIFWELNIAFIYKGLFKQVLKLFLTFNTPFIV